jgi:hypothetical protein
MTDQDPNNSRDTRAHNIPLSSYHDLQQAELWNRQHNEVMDELLMQALKFPDADAKLLTGLLEITNFMLKNTCGVGSNIKLADCDLARIEPRNIRKYYALVLAALACHFGQLLPQRKEALWQQVTSLCAEPELCRELAAELESCRDHQDGVYSPVRAGRRLWERVADLLCVKSAETNVTARIYYQTAPGQDLVYLVEEAVNEGWLREE